MKKKFVALLSLLIVAMSFLCVAENAGVGFNVIAAEETQQQSPGQDQEFTTTTTTAAPTTTTTTTTQNSTTQQTTETTTKPDSDKQTQPTEKPTLIDWGKLTTTKKNEDSTTVPVSENNEENSTGSEPGTEIDGSTTPSTTKKKTTTKRYTTTVPRMTIPLVENTQVEGTTLSPLDAYFERISDSSEENTYIFEEDTTVEFIEVEPERNLSTGAIIAICIGGIALLTCALTGLFVLRNKQAGDSEDVEYDDEYEEEYEEPDTQPDISNTNVDNTGSFKIMDYNNDELK